MRGTGPLSSEIRIFRIVTEKLSNDYNKWHSKQKNAEMVDDHNDGFQA